MAKSLTGLTLLQAMSTDEALSNGFWSVYRPLYASSWMRYVRASLIETLESGVIRAGRTRGFTPQRLIVRHALPNALIPLTTILGMDLALLFSGAVVMGTLMSGALVIVLCYPATDPVYGWLSSRERLGGVLKYYHRAA